MSRARATLRLAASILLTLALSVAASLAWAFWGLRGAFEGDIEGLGYAVIDTYVTVTVVTLPEGGVLLVDAGNDPDAGPLRAALAAHGHSLADVRAVLITHGHRDHTAALGLLPDAAVYALAAEVDVIEGRSTTLGPIPRLFPAAQAGEVDHRLQDGQSVVIGGRKVTVYAVPGHTAGSAAWRVDDHLFLGDAASFDTQGAVQTAPWIFSDDVQVNAQSLRDLVRRLASDPPAMVHTAHTGSLPREVWWTVVPG